ncbi:MAG: cation-transporting P-type ATPase, partial [Methanobacteriota archaeon]
MARKAWKAGVCVAAGLACATSSVTLACLIAARIISVSSSWSTSLPFALFSTAVLALVLSVNAALQLTDRWRAARRERAGSRAASSLPRTASAAWHSLSVTACEAVLGVPHVPGWPGLTHAQARAQQLRWGSNSAARPATSSIWRGAAKEVTEPQQVLLLCVAVLYALVGEVEEAALAMGVIALMVAAEVVTEHRAKTALASLQSSAPQYAWVRRRCDDSVGTPYDASAAHAMAWVEVRVLRADVVPGDIILLRAGHQVAADARLLRCTQLEVNEAQLTGESLPVSKHVREEHAHAGSTHDVDEEEACLPAVTPLAERSNMVHADTWVSRGAGVALVVNTGERTEVGQVMCTTRRISSKEKKTPLQVLMKRVAGRLTLVALAGSVAGGLLGLIKAASWQSILLTILSLAFATIPEELPILIAAVLAVGARALGQHRVFVKRLRAMEALSFINVVLTDKTGTLTHNSLRLRRVLCARLHEHGERGLSIGSGWVAAPVADPAGGNAAPAPQSSIALGCTGAEHAQQMLPQKLATQLVRACLFMADAGVLTHAAQLQHAHDPLDAAIGRALIDEQGAVLLSARAVERGTDGGARADVSHADTQEPLAPCTTAQPLAARATCEGLPVWEQAFDSTSKLAIRVFHERAHSANASADNEAEGSASVYLKGAPEAVLACCASALHDEGGDRAVPFTEALRAAVGSELEAAARAGLRTVAYARARVPWYASTASEWDAARADTARCVSLATRAQATLLGVACFEDPVRAEARGAV